MSEVREAAKRGSYKILLVLAYVLAMVITNQITTLYISYTLADHQYYQPFKWVVWLIHYGKEYANYFNRILLYFGLTIIIETIIFFLLRLLLYKEAESYSDVHGSAHWASKEEIEKMKLLDHEDGVYIGAFKDTNANKIKYLKHNGPEHILAFAPTRSGKGVGLVIPTLLGWRESCVVLDIKGENYELTAGWRQIVGQKVLKFDPVSQGGGVSYNPLEEIRLDGIYTVSDVQNIASIIIDPDGKGLEDHWAKTGYALLTTMILHMIYKCQKEQTTPSLSDLRGLINNPEAESVRDVLLEWVEYKHYWIDDSGNKRFDNTNEDDWITDPVVAVGAKEAANKPDNELGSVVSTVVSNLSLYDDPVVKQNIAKSGFKISDLMKYDSPVSLYLVIKPSDMNRLRPLTRIILNQILTLLIGDIKFDRGEQIKEYKYRLLLMLDEFTSLGKLPLFETALAYMAGYGLKAYIIIQDLTQLYKAYTKDEAIISNSHVRIAYAPNKVETAELISKMSGQTTVVKKVRTTSGKRGSLVLDQTSENYQEVQRSLLTVDECMQLPPDDMLIFIAGQPTIYGTKIKYFADPVFAERKSLPSPKSDILR